MHCFYYTIVRNSSMKLIKSMGDHPVILQRNLFYTLRHLLRFGLSKSDCISKITKEPAEIIGIDYIGQFKP